MPDSVDECADTAALLGTAEKLPADAEARARDCPHRVGLRGGARARSRGSGRRRASAPKRCSRRRARSGTSRRSPWRCAGGVRHLLACPHGRGAPARPRQYLREAIPLAARAGDDRLVARDASYLFNLLAYVQQRIQEAEAMLPHVEALVIRAGDHPDDRLEISFGQARSCSAPQDPRGHRAVRAGDRAERHTGERIQAHRARHARGKIGEIFLELENYPEAVRRMQRGPGSLKSIFGSRHPRILIALANLALAQSKVDGDAALATVAKMRELAATLPSEDWRAITIPFPGRPDPGRPRRLHSRAAILPRGARALHRRRTGRVSARADVHARLGACLEATGQRSAALARARTGARRSARAKATRRTVVALAAYELARALAARGATRRASDASHRARAGGPHALAAGRRHRQGAGGGAMAAARPA